jgi:mono/diheme cytochrome c family protein
LAKRRKADTGGSAKPVARRACRSCGSAVPGDARFCPSCGAQPDAPPADDGPSAARTVAMVAAAGLIAAGMFAAAAFYGGGETSPIAGGAPAPAPGTPPDLSTMSPREAADRLFNRVMTASEQGRREEAERFAPMAIQAYRNLAQLDRDGHYHLGLMYHVAGDRAGVARQIAALRQGAPDHLLAFVLEHDDATAAGDGVAAALAFTGLIAAHDAEIALGRPEYTAHRNVIEALRTAAGSPPGVSAATAPPVAAPPSAAAGGAADGAALFAANCAVCHGPTAAGSDRGPPLLHPYYAPDHHDDDAFRRAVRQGVAPHHWTFGPMPPLPGLGDDAVTRIIAYVRERQRASGIR